MDIDPHLADISDSLYRISVKALIFNNHKILLLKEGNDNFWSVPGGGVDYGETAEGALLRELEEEIGVMATDVKTDGKVAFVSIGTVFEGVPRTSIFYKVSVPPEKVRQTQDASAIGWFSADEYRQLVLSPTLLDCIEEIVTLINE